MDKQKPNVNSKASHCPPKKPYGLKGKAHVNFADDEEEEEEEYIYMGMSEEPNDDENDDEAEARHAYLGTSSG